jgi:L-seryl-tRNA(Ser) seleniumtransferase
LARTLAAYVGGRPFEEVPTLRMLALTARQIGHRASRVKRAVAAIDRTAGQRIALLDGVSKTGGGSSPGGERPTRLLAVSSAGGDAAALERRLRLGDPPIVGRVQEGRLLLDLRTVLPEQDELLAERLADVIREEAG